MSENILLQKHGFISISLCRVLFSSLSLFSSLFSVFLQLHVTCKVIPHLKSKLKKSIFNNFYLQKKKKKSAYSLQNFSLKLWALFSSLSSRTACVFSSPIVTLLGRAVFYLQISLHEQQALL